MAVQERRRFARLWPFKNGVASLAYVSRPSTSSSLLIHQGVDATKLGLARVPQLNITASRVNPTCGVEPGMTERVVRLGQITLSGTAARRSRAGIRRLAAPADGLYCK
jgi:hypothetical protein